MLEEDGTEVDEEEYFQFLPLRTSLIVMSRKEAWSPVDTWQGSGPDNPSTSLSSQNLAEALLQHLVTVQVKTFLFSGVERCQHYSKILFILLRS